jgi:hypothetical protein
MPTTCITTELSLRNPCRIPQGWTAHAPARGQRYLRSDAGDIVGYDLADDGLSDAYEIREALAEIVEQRERMDEILYRRERMDEE